MLCSMCKKNTAVIFINKQGADGKAEVEGLCYECAKKKGINPIDTMAKQANLSDKDIQDLSNKLDTMFKNLSDNMADIDEDELSEMINGESEIEGAQGVPLGSIFSGLFGIKQNGDESSNYSSGGTQKVKEKTKPNKKRKALDTYGTNLTVKAKNNQIDRVIGRDKEIERMIQILNRRSKNNPCLIGEPGVGKTAIAQGLALRIASGSVPAKLLNKEVYLLDMTAVIAGTQFRGQFEARMKAIIDECRNDGNIILVIDEIHNIIGAGDAEHSMNAANILKPSLANGELQMIGTTTLKEYRKYIEKDTALERRFQPIIVEEPSVEDAISILQGIKQYYEDYHHVRISNDIIRQIVNMSEKYIHDRFLPDKAIDILDEACSKINLNDKDLYDLEVLNNQLKEVQAKKEEAAQADSTEDYQKAAELKTQECALLEQIDNLKKRMQPKDLTTQDIANVIESWTKIPVNKITEEETKYINGYINELNGIRGTSSAQITEAGTYTLDGTQAVAFSRIRYTEGGDYKRSERQRTILFKIFSKAQELDKAKKIDIAKSMLDKINTNYLESEVLRLLSTITEYKVEAMDAFPKVFYSGKIDGVFYEVPVTLNDMSTQMHTFLYPTETYTPSETVQSISAQESAVAPTANNDFTQQ